MKAATHSALILAMAVGVALTGLSVISALSQEPIRQATQNWKLQNLSAVLPEGPFDHNPVDSRKLHIATELGGSEELEMYTAFKNGKPAAIVLELVSGEGYSGQIRLLLGLYPDGSIVAVRAIEHKETPGLGDAIEHRKSAWINQFESTSITAAGLSGWQLERNGGQFDGLSGATITSRAVIKAIRRALTWYDANRATVFDVNGSS